MPDRLYPAIEPSSWYHDNNDGLALPLQGLQVQSASSGCTNEVSFDVTPLYPWPIEAQGAGRDLGDRQDRPRSRGAASLHHTSHSCPVPQTRAQDDVLCRPGRASCVCEADLYDKSQTGQSRAASKCYSPGCVLTLQRGRTLLRVALSGAEAGKHSCLRHVNDE